MTSELQKKVVGLDVVKRPLQNSQSAGQSGNVVPHEGCVATTSDGQKYLIENGVAPDGQTELHRIGGNKGSRIFKIGSKLPQDFELEKKVTVVKQDATLMDLLKASGDDYNWLCNNCLNSTQRMQEVVSNELGLPWQVKLAGIVAVSAILLIFLGRLILRGPNTH